MTDDQTVQMGFDSDTSSSIHNDISGLASGIIAELSGSDTSDTAEPATNGSVETTPRDESPAAASVPLNSDTRQSSADENSFMPLEPKSLEESGVPSTEVEELILKYLLSRGTSTGRLIAE